MQPLKTRSRPTANSMETGRKLWAETWRKPGKSSVTCSPQ